LYDELRKQGAFEGKGGVSSDTPVPLKAADHVKAKSISDTNDDGKDVASKSPHVSQLATPTDANPKAQPLADEKLATAKTKCSALGFKEKSKDFGNCVYQLVQ
jgi:hypothetical protein